jgi:hypothetical protein
MLLLTDGTVLCHSSNTPQWWRLTPDPNGDYRRGTWSRAGDMHNGPLYFASAVLRSGKVFVAGGEYNFGKQVDLLAAEIYDPILNTWSVLPTPPGWKAIGDAPCCVLPDGRILLGSINDKRTAIYDPEREAWTETGTKQNPSSNEETWTLLSDGTVLTVDCFGHPAAERYLTTGQWVSAGMAVPDLVEDSSKEIGPAILLPDGRVFAVGATRNTALYSPAALASDPGTWKAGPAFPEADDQTIGAKDAPATLLPNGRVLCAVGPVDGIEDHYHSPTYCFEFDPREMLLTQVSDPLGNNIAPYETRMLLLPTGDVLFGNGQTIAVYHPDGAPADSWRPRITTAPAVLLIEKTHRIEGQQLNGLSQAVSYGDDASMATNYPLARLERDHLCWYCPTGNHSTMAVATGATPQHTDITIPKNVPEGPASLVLIANGIPSHPHPVNIQKPTIRRAADAE